MKFTVERNDCILRCDQIGQGPVLVLVHGIACDHSYFLAAAERLKKYYTVITYDRRGYSESRLTREDAAFDTVTQAEDLRAILDAVHCEKAIIAACSAGGLIALEFALLHPSRIRRLFLHETPLAADERFRVELEQWMEELQKAADGGRITRALLSLARTSGGIDPKAAPSDTESMNRNLENMKTFLYHEMKNFLTWGQRHREKLCLAPVCRYASGREDTEGLFSRMGDTAAQLLGCSCTRLPGYHNLAAEQPDVFADWIISSMNETN